MRSISPNAYQSNKDSFSSQPQQQQKAILKPVVYEAVHVPVNEQIVHANNFRLNMSPTHIAPPSGQTVYRTIQSPNHPIPQQIIQQIQNIQTFPQQKDLKLQTSVAEFQVPQSQSQETNSLKSDDRFYREFEDRIRVIRNESDSWKQKFIISENDKVKQLQDMENHYKMEMHNQSQQLKQFYQVTMNELNDELKHLQRELDNSNKEIEKARKKCHQLEMDQFELKTQIVDANAQKDQAQKELVRMTNLYQRIKIDMDEMRTQQEIMKKRIINEQELEKLKEIINQRENEIDDLKMRNSQLEILGIDVRKLDTQNHELQNQLEILQSQISIYETKIIEQRNEIDNLNSINKRMNNQLQEKKNHDKLSKTIYEQEMLNQLNQAQVLSQEKDNQIKSLNIQLSQLQLKYDQLQQQIISIRENYEQELTEARMKQGKFEQEFQDDITQKFQLMSREIQQLQQERQQLLNDLSQQSQQKIRLDQKLQQQQKEIDNFNYQSQLRNKELVDNQETINQMSKQVTNLSKEKQNLQEQIHKLHYQYQDFNKVNYFYEKVLCSIEMEALRERLDNALSELETIKANQLSMYKFS
ncbi:unnamed protein product [Paramecium pentaurelia]|uniref:Uncharacterized protein n=1 Tax=Paramecium pentaurelia TaxID=43138 RepID=A0A8S1TMD8_9CILI|nr:unnamed protein product [Paramecium pentaurelia]